ncbi:MAG: hypothetical protein JSS98_05785 [Bacteroidetes bacterium]|nr:hypothetical protein [Bacteroidota bacterium]
MPETFCGHKVILDDEQKILPRAVETGNAYDHFLRLRWNFIKTKVPNSPGPAPRSSYPQYYFYCAWKDTNNILEPYTWMDDPGEEISHWFESARLYYAYTGDIEPMNITKGMIDYSLAHGITPPSYSWPNFPQTGSNAGDLEFRGFTSDKRFSEDDVQVDHAGDIGFAYYGMFLFYGDKKYKTAAINVADALVKKLRVGNAEQSPWPYVVNMKSGKIVSDYGANWFGCIRLLDMLIDGNAGNVSSYKKVRAAVREWLLKYPMQNGLWVDGHTDNLITGTGNLSNMSASNAGLYLSDHPEFDPEWKANLPKLIKWTEDNFVSKSAPGEPSTMWGANIVGEQICFMPKMDYQTVRYAAQCAKWYAFSEDVSFKEKGFRSLNWVTYCNDSVGMAFESPVSNGVVSWWSDSYGECPRMFYHVFAAIPEWAPAREDHILFSDGVLKNVIYADKKVQYTASQKTGKEYLRLSFKPTGINLNGKKIFLTSKESKEGYSIKNLGNGDYSITIKRTKPGNVVVTGW